jgi:hypothetical protein
MMDLVSGFIWRGRAGSFNRTGLAYFISVLSVHVLLFLSVDILSLSFPFLHMSILKGRAFVIMLSVRVAFDKQLDVVSSYLSVQNIDATLKRYLTTACVVYSEQICIHP